ncbi:hypothetical protein EDC14_10087 [Hydrogenispora ethanolica]|uniref:Uncharacterized protein n=1 Tax=Hydrogenispora ethanolica TaxID=1082276 RepID=A0A4R1RY06_HYDET|nr:hypothetical protein [Hydrogenispora ethanolica]TCL70862.1 hypothetical protein EDC14_10087 [Hydrogenispora ethanolica]
MVLDRSLAAKLGRAEEMLTGLAKHVDRMQRRGIDADFIARMNACHRQVTEAHNRRLGFKARMMEQTVVRQNALAKLEAMAAEARNQIKVELPRETWREFGITDQR